MIGMRSVPWFRNLFQHEGHSVDDSFLELRPKRWAGTCWVSDHTR
jgi:hypothetical protein